MGISFFLFSTRRAAQTKKLEFLLKLVTLNVCARGSRDFPATPHPTDTVLVPGPSPRIPNVVCTTRNFLARSVPLRRPRKLALPSRSTINEREREDLTTEANTAAAPRPRPAGHKQPTGHAVATAQADPARTRLTLLLLIRAYDNMVLSPIAPSGTS